MGDFRLDWRGDEVKRAVMENSLKIGFFSRVHARRNCPRTRRDLNTLSVAQG